MASGTRKSALPGWLSLEHSLAVEAVVKKMIAAHSSSIISLLRCMVSPLVAISLGAGAAPLLCQEEQRPYFALNSGRTFGPGEKPVITLMTTNVSDLAFRVYRINDPFRFFESLEDPHVFGGQAQRPPTRSEERR